MKVCILGAGALGCTFGFKLHQAGHSVWLLNRDGSHIQAVKRAGLDVTDHQATHRVRLNASTDAAEVGEVDLVIVLVKSFHTEAAIKSAQPLIGPQTVVLSLQNGLGHEEVLKEKFGAERIVAGKTYVGGVLLSPGAISSSVPGKRTFIGELDGRRSERVVAIAKAFNDAGLDTNVSENIIGTMWDKLLVNVATGALCGITSLDYGQLYEEPELRDVALAAIAEGIAVAQSAGIKLTLSEPEAIWRLAAEGLPGAFKPSLLQSLEKGTVTEIDFINGAVVREGQRLGVATPINTVLVACVKGIEKSMSSRNPDNLHR